jgi:hypothetical protein
MNVWQTLYPLAPKMTFLQTAGKGGRIRLFPPEEKKLYPE